MTFDLKDITNSRFYKKENEAAIKSFRDELMDDLESALRTSDSVMNRARKSLDGSVGLHSDEFVISKLESEMSTLEKRVKKGTQISNRGISSKRVAELQKVYAVIIQLYESMSNIKEYYVQIHKDRLLWEIQHSGESLEEVVEAIDESKDIKENQEHEDSSAEDEHSK